MQNSRPRQKKDFPRKQSIRCAARALILYNDKILTVILHDNFGLLHVLPGGGQMHGETLTDTVQRECHEELGVKIQVGELAYVREYIGANHEFSRKHREFHQVETVFFCTISDHEKLGDGCDQDTHQIGFKWVPLTEFAQCRFSPSALQKFIQNGKLNLTKKYLGDNH